MEDKYSQKTEIKLYFLFSCRKNKLYSEYISDGIFLFSSDAELCVLNLKDVGL